ncbi:cytochrome c [Puteibacter caeruleilacunae]|nr:cytochrome c [Puteibacter caeruleilacunae]
MIRTTFFTLIILLIVSCGTKKTQQPIDQKVIKSGEQLYLRHCLSCHQKDGQGTPNMNPPLANNKTVTGDPEKLTKIVLFGQTGKIVVNGEEYNGIMAPHSHLTDKQLAEILTYIRNNWGNQANEITQKQVQTIRHQ